MPQSMAKPVPSTIPNPPQIINSPPAFHLDHNTNYCREGEAPPQIATNGRLITEAPMIILTPRGDGGRPAPRRGEATRTITYLAGRPSPEIYRGRGDLPRPRALHSTTPLHCSLQWL